VLAPRAIADLAVPDITAVLRLAAAASSSSQHRCAVRIFCPNLTGVKRSGVYPNDVWDRAKLFPSVFSRGFGPGRASRLPSPAQPGVPSLGPPRMGAAD